MTDEKPSSARLEVKKSLKCWGKHISSLTDPVVNVVNDNIQIAAAKSLENSDIMPQIPEWPEIGDLLSNAIQKASTGGNVDKLMKDAAKKTERILRRAGY
ncbi:MAG: hypothetical protein CM1200mP30_22380 [Pseudomonadota bacterium]|nr:MAG: hypothetical protein CM1200mP30_22380 [Pseudomonadota bacterium]